MSFYGRLIAVFVFIFSSSVFADSYPVVSLYTIGSLQSSTAQGVCDLQGALKKSQNNQLYDTWALSTPTNCRTYDITGAQSNNYPISFISSCPGGGTVSGFNCIDAPACVSPQVRNATTGMCETPPVCKSAETLNLVTMVCDAPVCIDPQINDIITGACIVPFPPDCIGVQTPINTYCRYPVDRGDAINCSDGLTVYPPMVCVVSPWDDKLPPKEGEQKTCSDGSVIGYPTTCFDIFKQQAKDVFGIDKALAIVLNTLGGGLPKPVLRVVHNLVSGLPEIRSVLPIAAKVNQSALSAYSKIDTSLPTITVGKAIAEYIKSSPTSPYVDSLKSAVRSGVTSTELMVNPNTGVVTPGTSLVPLSSNQLADLAMHSLDTAPLPLAEIEPFVSYPYVPYLEPALDAIDVDFKRIYDLAGQKAPFTFPQIVPTNPLISPTPLESSEPLVTLGPESPLSYPKPAPVTPSSLPSPTVNTNPTGTDFQTSPSISPDPATPVDPNVVETPPLPPTLYPDYWKFFDFLPMANPFVIDVKRFIPTLPEPTCYYEIHRTFHVPLLGNKSFDLAPCAPLQPLRTVLAWVFSVLSIYTCFFVIFRSSM